MSQEDESGLKAEFTTLLAKLGAMSIRILGVCYAAVAHKLLDWLIGWTLPAEWVPFGRILEGVFAIAIGLIYLALVWEMVVVFIPALARKRPKKVN